MRRPKTDRVARTRADGEWTEAAFWGFVRSHLRQMSKRWPPRRNALTAARRPHTGPNARQKWEHVCDICGGAYKATEVAVDHIVPCGQLSGFDDIGPFVERLLVDSSGFRVLCKECHKGVTAEQRKAAANRS